MLEGQTVSISIGVSVDGHQGSSIVLPRGHELLKHLEALLPAITKKAPATPPAQAHQDAMVALATLAQQSTQNSPVRPSSPHYDSCSSSTSSQPASSGPKTGTRRRRAGTAVQAGSKRCQIPDCDKISVSRGLCRGHGGGRRCQHPECSKGAQSRSDFCWAHGGGQRCEVKGCMRSRKSKRYCVAHLTWENYDRQVLAPVSAPATYYAEPPKVLMPRVIAPAVPEYVQPQAKLPSLRQALQKNQCINAYPAPAAPMCYTPFVHSA
ncbi:hypothetical protein Poli38472_010363 [Pythium oligandrum]|uniref:WRKY19-like zinc finger domain-containing protein n=1 Tax=Pythium oligandrum TaxID=41045 RepID=A0A8K1C2X8_PYTOL|nr:hypothetical protein Poli38472_010363 [Pythium oligandrum]|eukprot:TMW55481.1 hypothetical protein Poli38472_010363 [Pythium oligandrum]